jgi:alpha-glucosidase
MFKGRDGCRTPMVWTDADRTGGFTTGKPWLPVPAAHLPLAVSCQQGDPASVLAAYRAMLAFRKSSPALRLGSIRFVATPPGMLGFVRRHEDEMLLCLFNFLSRPTVYDRDAMHGPRPAGPGTRAASGTTPCHPVQPLPAAGPVTLDAYGVCIGPVASMPD